MKYLKQKSKFIFLALFIFPLIFISCSSRYLVDPKEKYSSLKKGDRIEILKSNGEIETDRYVNTVNDSIECKKNKYFIKDIRNINKINLTTNESIIMAAFLYPMVVFLSLYLVYASILSGMNNGE